MKERYPNPVDPERLDPIDASKRRERRRDKALGYLLALPALTVACAATCWILKLFQVQYAPKAFPETLTHHALVVGVFFASLAVATRIFLDHQRFWSWRAGVLASAIVSLVVAWLI